MVVRACTLSKHVYDLTLDNYNNTPKFKKKNKLLLPHNLTREIKTRGYDKLLVFWLLCKPLQGETDIELEENLTQAKLDMRNEFSSLY